MKNLHSTMKALFAVCTLIFLLWACKRNDIPSPPGKHEWLLSKITTLNPDPNWSGSVVLYLEYNVFNKPRLVTEYGIRGKGDTGSYFFTYYRYNAKKQLTQVEKYDSIDVCKMGTCIWEIMHMFTNYDYDASGRISQMTSFSEQLGDTSTAPHSTLTASYQDTIVTYREPGSTYANIYTYNRQGNLLKKEYVPAGITHVFGPYDSAPNVPSLTNLPIDFRDVGSQPLSKNNPMNEVMTDKWHSTFPVRHEYLYNQDSLVTQMTSRGLDTTIEKYEYIKVRAVK